MARNKLEKRIGLLLWLCLSIVLFGPELATGQSQTFRRIKTVSQGDGQIRLGSLGVVLNASAEEMSRAVVEKLMGRLREIVGKKGVATVRLPAGRTYEKVYEILRTQFRDDPIWQKVILVQLDEYVGSNKLRDELDEKLVRHLRFNKFLAIDGTKDIALEVERINGELEKIGGLDLLFLGLGANGAIALNEPGSGVVNSEKLVDTVKLSPETKKDKNIPFTHAFTPTLKLIREAKEVILVVSGETESGKPKAPVVEEALLGKIDTRAIPATVLQERTEPTSVFLDHEAATEKVRQALKTELKKDIRSYLQGRSVNVFATDLDFTLSPLGEKVRDEVIGKLAQLARKGIHIAIISGARFERTQRQLLAHLPRDFPWQYLHVYSHVGAAGYSFDQAGNRIRHYEIEIPFYEWEGLRQAVEEFRLKFKDDFKDYWETEGIKATIELKDRLRTREVYETYLAFLGQRFKGTGLVINGSGHFGTIDITYTDKSLALKNLQYVLDVIVPWEEMVYVGDAFSGKFANDLPTLIPGIKVFNVGSIDAIPQGIFSLGIRGDLGTEALIEVLLER